MGSGRALRSLLSYRGLFSPWQGDLGPFSPGLPVVVPLWLAINLKQRQKCRLIPPEWMDVGKGVGGVGGAAAGWAHRGPSSAPLPADQLQLMNGSRFAPQSGLTTITEVVLAVLVQILILRYCNLL